MLMLVVNRHRDPDKHFALMDNIVLASGKRMYSVGQAPAVAGATPPKVNAFDGLQRQLALSFSGHARGDPQAHPPGRHRSQSRWALHGEGTGTGQGVQGGRQSDLSLPAHQPAGTAHDGVRVQVGALSGSHRHPQGAAHRRRSHHLAEQCAAACGLQAQSPGLFDRAVRGGCTLVVQTSGFSPQPWGNASGIDSSNQKRIVERYRLIDGGHGNGIQLHGGGPRVLHAPGGSEGHLHQVPRQ